MGAVSRRAISPTQEDLDIWGRLPVKRRHTLSLMIGFGDRPDWEFMLVLTQLKRAMPPSVWTDARNEATLHIAGEDPKHPRGFVLIGVAIPTELAAADIGSRATVH